MRPVSLSESPQYTHAPPPAPPPPLLQLQLLLGEAEVGRLCTRQAMSTCAARTVL
jgi:hypothetical protein